jgi:hypothetical protein
MNGSTTTCSACGRPGHGADEAACPLNRVTREELVAALRGITNAAWERRGKCNPANVRRDFSFFNAHSYASKVLRRADIESGEIGGAS